MPESKRFKASSCGARPAIDVSFAFIMSGYSQDHYRAAFIFSANLRDEHTKPLRAENDARALSREPLATCGPAWLSRGERCLSSACKRPSAHTVHYCEPHSSESFRSSNPS